MSCKTLGLVLFLFLTSPQLIMAEESSVWWKIELSISVTGTYRCLKTRDPLYGHYSFQGVWQGAMERDNGDYILYQVSDWILYLKWVEEHMQEKFDQSGTVKPRIKLNYVLRRDGKIHFDFESFSFRVPLENSKKKYKLVLPRSAENDSINLDIQYNKYVTGGTNRVELPEKRIYRENLIEERYSWNWEKIQGEFSSQHSVGVVIKITKTVKGKE